MLLASSVLTAYLRLSSPWIIILLAVGLDDLHPARREARRPAGNLPLSRPELEHGGRGDHQVCRRDRSDRDGLRRAGRGRRDFRLGHLCLSAARQRAGTSWYAAVAGNLLPWARRVQAIVFFVGQVIISNIDILMVKHFFPPDLAGLYAAIALVGRLLYFGAWSIVSAMFPVSAENKRGAPGARCWRFRCSWSRRCRWSSFCCWRPFPQLVFRSLFGAHFHTVSRGTELAVEHERGGDRDLRHQRRAYHV